MPDPQHIAYCTDNTPLRHGEARLLFSMLFGRTPAGPYEIQPLVGKPRFDALSDILTAQEFTAQVVRIACTGTSLRHFALETGITDQFARYLAVPSATPCSLLTRFFTLAEPGAVLITCIGAAQATLFINALKDLSSHDLPDVDGAFYPVSSAQIKGWVQPHTDGSPRTLDILINESHAKTIRADGFQRKTSPDSLSDWCGYSCHLLDKDLRDHSPPYIISVRDHADGQPLFPAKPLICAGISALKEIETLQSKIQTVDTPQQKKAIQTRLERLDKAVPVPVEDYDHFVRSLEYHPYTANSGMLTILSLAAAIPNTDQTAQAKNASSPWLVFLPDAHEISALSDDTLTDALSSCHTDTQVLLLDHDTRTDSGVYTDPVFKASVDYPLLMSTGYTGPAYIIRRDIFLALGGFDPAMKTAQHVDLLLRVYERTGKAGFGYIPYAQWHTRGEDITAADLQKAASAHLGRTNTSAETTAATNYTGLSVRWRPPVPAQKLAIIIPTRDKASVVKTCVDSLLSRMDAPEHCDILIVDNDSSEDVTHALFKDWTQNGTAQIIPYPHAFNWSAQNNLAAKHTDADLLLFLNNDTTAMTQGFDTILRGYLYQPWIGIVGAKLLFGDDRLQHAGVTFDASHAGWMEGVGEAASAPGYRDRYITPHTTDAVIGAFMAIRKDTFDKLGGFDEKHLAITQNDFDLCLKARADGLDCMYAADIVFSHIGWESRGKEDIYSSAEARRSDSERTCFTNRWHNNSLINSSCYPAVFARSGTPYKRIDPRHKTRTGNS